ncbi:MAG TPA: EAL domain-containing protein [Steroidobacteraceae bacterium]|nr:EAL domain-containing protein [Steroidobacteraceae bacterium]
MTSPPADPYILALAGLVAILASYVILTVATELAGARARRAGCHLLLSALVLGSATYVAISVEALASGLPAWRAIGRIGLSVPLAIAVASQACALLFVAFREPDGAAIAGSGFSLAVGIFAIRWTEFDALESHPGSSGEWVGACAFTALLFLGFTGGLWQLLRLRRETLWRLRLTRVAAALAMAAGMLGGRVRPLVLWQPLSEGTALTGRLVALTLTALACGALAVTQVVAIYRGKLGEHLKRNARELKELNARLQHIATHDALTGLPNRHLLKERLAKALSSTEHPGRTIAVAMLDLDRFSALNHSLGHGVGDRLLAEIAQRLESAVSNDHTLARVGGDEFAVLIDHVAARLEAQTVTSAILATLARPIYVNGEEVRVRPSIGVSVWPDDARRADDLLAHAEAAMRGVKQRGGCEVSFFKAGMSDSMQERLALENDLRRALTAGEFELHYQPQLSSRTGRILAIEALLRWRHPTKGLITPNSFIPLAEETGLIVALDEWALHEMCRQTRSWQVGTGTNLRVGVNLSAAQFRRQNILHVIRTALDAAHLDASALEIELTESTLMTNLEESAAALKELRAMGISIAIDDFGTGYSSLSYLRRLPIDKLKIDRSFVRDITSSRTDELIVRAIISLAHSVGLQVVAEGVETAEQLEFIRSLECDQWQGYYCCQPQPAASIEEMLMERNTTRTGVMAALARASRRRTS